MRKAKAQPLRFNSEKRDFFSSKAMRNRRLVQDYQPKQDPAKELDYHIEDSMTRSFKQKLDDDVKISTAGYGVNDSSEIKFPSPGLLNLNGV